MSRNRKRNALRSDFGFYLWLLLVAGLLAAIEVGAQRRPITEERIGDGTMVTVLPQDAIPALTNPVFLSRAEAERLMDDNEPVLGLVIRSRVRPRRIRCGSWTAMKSSTTG